MATLKDVARETGLTVTTVSRVLNNRGYISEETREKVYEAMKKLNYRPNEVARSLSKKSTNTIGVIVPHIRHPYFSELISNLENEASKRGYKMILCNSQELKITVIASTAHARFLFPIKKTKNGNIWRCVPAIVWQELCFAALVSQWKNFRGVIFP